MGRGDFLRHYSLTNFFSQGSLLWLLEPCWVAEFAGWTGARRTAESTDLLMVVTTLLLSRQLFRTLSVNLHEEQTLEGRSDDIFYAGISCMDGGGGWTFFQIYWKKGLTPPPYFCLNIFFPLTSSNTLIKRTNTFLR